MSDQLTADQIRDVLAERGFVDYVFVKREFKYLARVLNRDEHPLAAVSGLMSGNSILCVLTSRQIWFIDHGLIYGVRSSTIPLTKVNAVSYQSHLIFSDIEITNGADVTMIRNVGRKSAQKFVNAVNDYLSGFHDDQQVADKTLMSTDDLASQLTELKKLVDSGALTATEFQRAKAKLLGGISEESANDDHQSDDDSSKPSANKNKDDGSLGGHGIGL